jgi:ribosomal protein S14
MNQWRECDREVGRAIAAACRRLSFLTPNLAECWLCGRTRPVLRALFGIRICPRCFHRRIVRWSLRVKPSEIPPHPFGPRVGERNHKGH